MLKLSGWSQETGPNRFQRSSRATRYWSGSKRADDTLEQKYRTRWSSKGEPQSLRLNLLNRHPRTIGKSTESRETLRGPRRGSFGQAPELPRTNEDSPRSRTTDHRNQQAPVGERILRQIRSRAAEDIDGVSRGRIPVRRPGTHHKQARPRHQDIQGKRCQDHTIPPRSLQNP